MRPFLLYCASALAFGAACPAYAVGTIAGTAVSGPIAGAVVAGGSLTAGAGGALIVVETSWWEKAAGYALFAGGLIVIAVDPADATYYNGQFAINFDSSLLEPVYSGWLGDWGDTPADLAPPVYPAGGFPDGTEFAIHSANPALINTVDNDLISGTQTVAFDWGPSGHAVSSSGQFNFFATIFRAKQNQRIHYLGTSSDFVDGANIYTTNLGIACTYAGSEVMAQCGSPATQYFSTTPGIPEPGTWTMMIGGFALVGAALRYRKSNPSFARGF